MKAALVTIHIPVKDISKQLTKKSVESVIKVVIKSLRRDFIIHSPKVALLGLNPHAGEKGKIGNEELELLNPLVKKFKKILTGPHVPDAFFGNQLFKKFDCTIGIYHDQLLIPFKLLNFNKGVNFTAGLPIVRTSPDHGTAFDIAGKYIAKEGSMLEAYKYANLIVNNRKSNLENS
jgi:4-hydroxythreonine-4-phosphate dehydrogenase